MSTSVPIAPQGAVFAPQGAVVVGPDLYAETTDLSQALQPEQIEELKRNQLTSFSPGLAVFLSILTLGIFPLIFYGLKNEQLPRVKEIDASNGKFIGFMFIPYFNIYWQIVAWARFVDRINFQLRLRGKPIPFSRTRANWALPLVLLFGVGYIIALMNVFSTQKAINELAAERGA
jgi:hypothetical protein